MVDRNVNPLLTSLSVLREIEEDRLRKEEDIFRQRAEAEQRAREESLAREAEQLRLAKEEEQAIAEAVRQEAREAQLQLAEAEQATRIDAEAMLKADERMFLEVETLTSSGRRMRWVVPSFVGLAVLLAVGLGYVFGVHLPDRQRQQEEASQRRIRQMQDRAAAERKALLERFDKQNNRLQATIANFRDQDQEEAKRLKARIERLQEEQTRKPNRKVSMRPRYVRRTRTRTRAKPPKKPDSSLRNNPLRDLFQ